MSLLEEGSIRPGSKRSTFHEPNLIAPIMYMTRSMFESMKFDRCYLCRLENYVLISFIVVLHVGSGPYCKLLQVQGPQS